MTMNDIFSHTFRNMGRELGLKVELFEGHIVAFPTMWRKALSTESQFCKAVVAVVISLRDRCCGQPVAIGWEPPVSRVSSSGR